jgi:Na+/melibiose symporter-like transporter
MLVGAISVAYFYPLTRQRHARILRLLEKRRAKEAALQTSGR